MNIKLGTFVTGVTKEACYHLSGIIQNGLLFVGNPYSEIVVKRNEIDFGITRQSEFYGINGMFMAYWYCENGHIKYKYGPTIGCSLSGKISYKGFCAPSEPDNKEIFTKIYKKLGI